jgi:hypothetical protein
LGGEILFIIPNKRLKDEKKGAVEEYYVSKEDRREGLSPLVRGISLLKYGYDNYDAGLSFVGFDGEINFWNEKWFRLPIRR